MIKSYVVGRLKGTREGRGCAGVGKRDGKKKGKPDRKILTGSINKEKSRVK